jgi:CheY-like chemotaxis protein
MEPRGGILTFTVSEVTWSENDLEIPVNLAPDRYLKISVADTGKGIAEEILPLIFEPYFTNKPTGEGTGLGLSVVHGIAKKYGGDVLVSSQVNQGAVFTVYLPIIRKYRPKQSRQGDTIPTGQGRILFVDDELFICDMFSQILERLGYTVTCRTSSVEALGLFRSKPNDFDLVITDMTMPNMTGDVLAAQLIQIRPEIPLVLCTGYSKSISEKKALEIGIRAFVMKPLVVKELANIVHGILNPSAAAPPNPKQ